MMLLNSAWRLGESEGVRGWEEEEGEEDEEDIVRVPEQV